MSNNLENDIKQTLNSLIDPDLGKSFCDLEAVKQVIIKDGIIKVNLEMIGPVHWVAESVCKMSADAIGKIAPGVETEIVCTEKEQDNGGRKILPKVKNIVAVASGKGGVGKSAVASNLAAALSLQGATVGVLDGDIYGPSQPTMFGLVGGSFDAVDDENGNSIAFPLESHGIKVASMGFLLNRDDAAIIRGPMLAGYFSLLFEQLEWGELDFLIFDLPPGTGDIQLTMTQKIPMTGAVIVTTPQEISVSDVRRSIAMFRKVNVDILGIVENMAYFVPPDMTDKKYYIFGQGGGKKVATESDISFLGEIPLNMEMREANDGGTPIVIKDEKGYQSEVIREITAKVVAQVRRHNLIIWENPNVEISI